MSNHLAIATVTATLRQVLEDAVSVDITGASATAVRPNAPEKQLPHPGVNLFLYQTTPNTARRNADLPSRGSDGRLRQRPRAAVDLHYLLSFYGSDAELEPQRVLGTTLRVLHEQPILQPRKIAEVIEATDWLQKSNLDKEAEAVRFTQLPLSLEELAKLWSVFFQSPYVLSVAFVGTVVLIEGESIPLSPLPVRQRNLYVLPFGQPVVERVVSAADPQLPVMAGGTLRICGRGLRGDLTRVRIGRSAVITPNSGKVGETELEVQLPPELCAGVHAVQVEHPRMMGTPPTAHGGVESNALPFVLHPAITATVSSVVPPAGGATLTSAAVTVTFVPPVGRAQRVRLLLNELNPPPDRPAHACTFDPPPGNGITATGQEETASIPFSVELFAGSYLCRVQVDGAESLLVADADGRFTGPKVTI